MIHIYKYSLIIILLLLLTSVKHSIHAQNPLKYHSPVNNYTYKLLTPCNESYNELFPFSSNLNTYKPTLMKTFKDYSINKTGKYYLTSRNNFLFGDMDKYKLTLKNNFLWLIPPLAWNIAWGVNNPAQLGNFCGEAPQSILITENILRVSSMMYPLLLPIKSQTRTFKAGLFTYLAGSVLYYASWTYLMKYPDSQLSQTAIMRFAPAYTPLIWLTGISLMSRSKIHFTLSTLFIGFHVTEYILRYTN